MSTLSLPRLHPAPLRRRVAAPSSPTVQATADLVRADDAPSAPSIESTALLAGHKVVAIAHNGFIYRLQATKLGKLILTK